LPTTVLLLAFEVTLSLPTTVGSADAHRRKRQRSRGPTHHVRQAEVIEVVITNFARDYCVHSCAMVIQVFVKTLNLCIIKMPESFAPADPYAKSRVFLAVQKPP
jgi:hypothetical protein